MNARINDGLSNWQRSAARKFASAQDIPCECGCGTIIKDTDKSGRKRRFAPRHGINNPSRAAGARKAQKAYINRRPDGSGREQKKLRYRKFKLRAMALLGNYCFHCGLEYNGQNAAVFDFHHVDPASKSGGISEILINKAWSYTLAEIAKCDLLCKNCHAIHHGGRW